MKLKPAAKEFMKQPGWSEKDDCLKDELNHKLEAVYHISCQNPNWVYTGYKPVSGSCSPLTGSEGFRILMVLDARCKLRLLL